MKKLRRRDIFRLLERDCVSPITEKAVKDYINRLHEIIESNKKVGGRK